MIYAEERRDLFSLGSEYILVHCISADFALGAGIAKVFRDKYGVRGQLLRDYRVNVWDGNGECLFTTNNTAQDGTGYRLVANLVTKEKYYHKPTYETVKQSLKNMKKMLQGSNTFYKPPHKIGMPLIGCGLDGLQWERVSAIVKEVFNDTDFEILVCRI
ncbi:MAG: macro domain-containing protein [Bacteroides sp.]|nr:macro domain-containing protein [Eubacterium sp.]MCM1417656.1 macro domain-containing protein [Roseburia sp.]MCM1461879.1 macro domain-containing protein [Bacteroides sp.]